MTIREASSKLFAELQEKIPGNLSGVGISLDNNKEEIISVMLVEKYEEPYTTYESYNVTYKVTGRFEFYKGGLA